MAAVLRELSPRRSRDADEVIAVILADGSVKELRGGRRDRRKKDFGVGSLTGPDWVLWWQRRSFDD